MRRDSTSPALDEGQLLTTLIAFKKGDFSVRMPVTHVGVAGKIADTLNDIVEMNTKLADDLARVGNVVGKQGRITQRVAPAAGGGQWPGCVEAVNNLIGDLRALSGRRRTVTCRKECH